MADFSDARESDGDAISSVYVGLAKLSAGDLPHLGILHKYNHKNGVYDMGH